MDKIDHIGIAVKSLAEALPVWTALLGINADGEEEVPYEQVRVAFFGSDTGRIELLEATGPESPIAQFIEKRGPGVHHIALRVADLEAALDRARRFGLDPIAPGIREGAGGHRVAFLHPRDTGGVLTELTEAPAEGQE